MTHIKRRIQEGDPKVTCLCEDVEGTLWFKDISVVQKKEALKKKILDEAHLDVIYSFREYQDVSWPKQFWWTRTKRETTRYVFEYDTCRNVKTDYMKPGEWLQPLSVLDWKWDDISMYFI
jgi:hypothetical protein